MEDKKKLAGKIMVTGAGGFVGSQLMIRLNELRPLGVTFDPTESSQLVAVDLREKHHVKALLNEYKPEVILHMAALTSPAINEENRELAEGCNLLITKNLVENLPQDCHLIFHSTDKVWTGEHSNPNEETPVNPMGYYAELKLECEQLIMKEVEKHHILRLGIIHDTTYKKAISRFAGPGGFVEKALDNLKLGEKVEVFSNVKRCFTKRSELVDFHHQLLGNQNYGTYNVGSKMLSYFDRLNQLCDEIGIIDKSNLTSTEGKVNPIEQNLDTSKLEKVFNIKFT